MTEFHVLIERDSAVFFDKDYNYVGIRLFLDDKKNPILRIEDHKDGSLYIDPKTNQTVMEWQLDHQLSRASRDVGLRGSHSQFLIRLV